MARLRNIGTKVQSLTLPPAREVTLQPGEEISGAPVYMALKLQEGNDFAVEWEPGEIKHKDGNCTYISYRGPVSPWDGYGLVSIQHLYNFPKYGVHVTFQQPELFTPTFASVVDGLERHHPDILKVINRPDKYPTKWGLVHAIPPDLQFMKTKYKVLHSMWEARQLPTEFQGVDWDYWAKQADVIIVPSSGQEEIFRASGCKQPIHVVPDTMELDDFSYMDRPTNRDVFTFITWGRLSARKDPLRMISCFSHAMGNKKDVQFIVKTRNNLLGMYPMPTIKDQRVKVINDNWSTAQLKQAVFDADVYVGMSHGEGWMVPPCLAASSGLPCIVPSHSGTTDWAKPGYFLTCGLDPKQPYEASTLGSRDGKPLEWWVMNADEVIEAMRWCYEHRDDARKLGKKASRFINKNFSVDVSMAKLTGVIRGLE